MTSLFIVVNEDRFFLSHRKPIAVAALAAGYDVTIVTKNTGRKEEILSLGVKYIELPVNPTGKNILEELKTCKFLLNLFKREKPDIVHNVGLKMILWGGVAAYMAKIKLVVSAVSGLGVMFSGEKLSLQTRMVLKVIKFTHRRKGFIAIFQNKEDKSLFLSRNIVNENQTYFIKGSGVDLNEYCYSPDPDNFKTRVIFTGRMVKEKGIITLIEAAEILREEYSNKVEFLLCGGLSQNPLAIKEEELKKLCDGTYIKWLGHRSDIKELLTNSNIVAFPSYYREGVPKSLIEASAIGRPIITTNSIGCKDVVVDGENGFLIQIKDSFQLSDKLKILIDDKELRIAMGKKSRLFAERDFSIKNVIKIHLDIYSLVS